MDNSISPKSENFHKMNHTIAAITKENNPDFHEATYEMLQAYWSTPHHATTSKPKAVGSIPTVVERIRTKLEHFCVETSSKDDHARHNDKAY